MPDADHRLSIEIASPNQRAAAMKRLHLGETQISRLLSDVQSGHLNLDGLFHATRGDRSVGAGWGQLIPGKMGFCWPAHVVRGEPKETLVLLQAAVDRFLDAADITLSQAVVNSPDAADARQLKEAGYRHLADLAFLVCHVDLICPQATPDDIEYETVPFDAKQRWIELIQSTYIGSADCPELDGLRDPIDVLEGYRHTGTYRPDWWMIAKRDGRDIGCVLLADHPEFNQCELLYMGLAPAARGRGIGQELTQQAQRMAMAEFRPRLTLAVDKENEPAKSIYDTARFEHWDTRSVLVRTPDRSQPMNPVR